MENKLQELTKKLYDEGLSKGRKEADALVAEAKAEAKKIIANAQSEAAQIARQAKNSADDLHKNTLTELNLAGKQVIGKLKESVQDMIVAKTTGESVAKVSLDSEFIKEMLIAVAKNWQGSSSEKISLSAMLPEAQKNKLGKEFEASIKKNMGDGMEIVYSDGVKSGFRIGPKSGGYYITFSDDSFNALLGGYLRPKVNEVLYGDKE